MPRKLNNLIRASALITCLIPLLPLNASAQEAPPAPVPGSLEGRVEALENWVNQNDPTKMKPGEMKPSLARVGAGNVQFDGLIQIWALYDPTTVFGGNEDADTTMRLRRTEIRASGDILPWFGFNVMIDPAKQIRLNTTANEEGELTTATVDQSTNVLQDLILQLRLAKAFPALESVAPNLQLDVGQEKTPITEEGFRSSAKLDMVERAMISRTYGEFRDVGLLLRDSHQYLDYYLGVFNGSGRNKTDDNDEKDFVGHVIAKPVKELHLGVFGQNGSTKKEEITRDRLGFDGQYELGYFSLKSEWARGKDGDVDSNGFYVQPGVYFIPDKLQLVARFDQFDPDTDQDDNTIQEIAGCLNWFFAKFNARLQLEYLRRNNEAATDENVVFINLQGSY